MTAARNTPGLDALIAQVRQIGRGWTVVLELDQASVNKAHWLAARGRDFFSVTPAMRDAVAREVVAEVRSGGLAVVERVAPEAIRRHIVRRFEAGGVDTSLTPLTDRYLRWKLRHGLDPRIGIAHRDLLNAVQSCPIRLVRKG